MNDDDDVTDDLGEDDVSARPTEPLTICVDTGQSGKVMPGSFVYMGEIQNMFEHGLFLSLDTNKMSILHLDRFRVATEDEL